MGLNESTRKLLASHARRPSTRSVAFTREAPTKFHPTQVLNPNCPLGTPFSDAGAWGFIADCLENGHDVEEVPLKQPAGKIGYVLKVEVGAPQKLYIKLQLGAAGIICRSFHYSDE